MTVVLELAVTDTGFSLADADRIASAAEHSGVDALRILDGVPGSAALDPSVVGAYLAARHGDLGYLIDATTTRNAPYNLARRVRSLDRATGGRAGLVLRPGDGDDVSGATTPDPTASDSADRWAEYVGVLTALWESFPSSALIGDQERAIVVDSALVRSIDHSGRFYRVAGPLDGPSSVQGRPPIVVADPAALGWARAAEHADAVIVDGYDDDLAPALEAVGRARTDIAVLTRVNIERETRHDGDVDGVVLATDGRDLASVLDIVRALAPGRSGVTLREKLGLRSAAGVSV